MFDAIIVMPMNPFFLLVFYPGLYEMQAQPSSQSAERVFGVNKGFIGLYLGSTAIGNITRLISSADKRAAFLWKCFFWIYI